MSTQAKQAAPVPSQALAKKDERSLVRDLVEKMKPQIKLALPRHMDPDRMARVFLTAVQRVPLLLKCTQESLAASLITASQLGLEPDGMMGHGYLIPFKNNRKGGIYECQFMPGYRGLMKVARQSGEISTLYARAVYRKDTFKYTCGLDEAIEHIPYEPDIDALNARAADEKWDRDRYERELTDACDRGVLRAVYAVAKFKDGGYQFEVMSRLDVDLIRARSKSANEGPWVTDYDTMALKSVMKRLCKWTPGSIEKDMAVGLIDRSEAGLPQDLGEVIDTTFVSDEPLPAAPKGALDQLVEKEGAVSPSESMPERAAKQALEMNAKKSGQTEIPIDAKPKPKAAKAPAAEKKIKITDETADAATNPIAGEVVDADSGQCQWQNGDGEACTNEGLMVPGVGYRCGAHPVRGADNGDE